jgi:hypothetical protein
MCLVGVARVSVKSSGIEERVSSVVVVVAVRTEGSVVQQREGGLVLTDGSATSRRLQSGMYKWRLFDRARTTHMRVVSIS